jgi:GDP-4-dehydro-6-deoxy-D-mannose reductase
MRLLITGISGFVGQHLARLAQTHGHEVHGTYVDPAPELPGVSAERLYVADLLDGDALAAALEAADPEVVIHLAGLAHPGKSWQLAEDYYRVNVLGTEKLLDALAARQRPGSPGTPRLVLASSGAVYGRVPEALQPICEDQEPAPANPYAWTKEEAERLVLHRWPAGVIARSFNLAGPGQSTDYVLAQFASDLAKLRDSPPPRWFPVGNLQVRRDFLHVEDGAAAYLLLAERGAAGQVYNIASEEAWSLGEVLALLQQIAGVEVEAMPDPKRAGPPGPSVLRGRAERLKALGWVPRKSMPELLAELWQSALGELP